MTAKTFTPESIAKFWESHPCGAEFIPNSGWMRFFQDFDTYKFSREPHTLEEFRKINFRGKRVLEIGLGQGSEAQKIIEAGGIYNGIDLTNESISRVKLRFELFSLDYESLKVMNAEELDFLDESFDIVFSHGVIHHSPRIERIVEEMHRVLKTDGIFRVMVYHKNSINYHISIKMIRRLGIFFLLIPGGAPVVARLTNENIERLKKHLFNLRKDVIGYLKMENFIHKSTDGPDNVYSKVLSKEDATRLFSKFRNLEFSIYYFNERHFPIIRNLLSTNFKEKIASKYGWHLWVKGRK